MKSIENVSMGGKSHKVYYDKVSSQVMKLTKGDVFMQMLKFTVALGFF